MDRFAKIPLKKIRIQLYQDLVGKDSHRGVTLTYAWMANQIGHFALGFIPSYIIFQLSNSNFYIPLFVALFWLSFETFNVVFPLRKKLSKTKTIFKPHWKNLIFDTFTDLCFFWLGCGAFYLIEKNDSIAISLFSLLLIIIFIFSSIWFTIKMYQQNAGYPFQFRLSQWKNNISITSIKDIRNFLEVKPRGQHILIYGEGGSGKTSLGIALANEFSIRRGRSYYTTMQKLIPKFDLSKEELESDTRTIWNWRSCHTLIIDDIHSESDLELMNLNPHELLMYLRKTKYYRENLQNLINTNVIWIVGRHCSFYNGIECTDAWHYSLNELGVKNDKILTVNLSLYQGSK